ncbi:MAG TPA: (deoxy)nucleoside triphosphate pyrophosphohydrolase [Candidatus Polarisedimenticolaceae bacterium]|nr:(deoxy)nucleoside triphosphate pyrophosphohydrolase [Candidatus Polarisedimenticolaceae bacterium]
MAEPGFTETAERVDIAIAIAVRGGRVLVARRAEGRFAGNWEFPGGKIEPGESPEAAARRELREETALEAVRLEPLVLVVHDYAELPLRLHVFLAREPAGEARFEHGRDWAWVAPPELERLEMPAANRQMLGALRWRLG